MAFKGKVQYNPSFCEEVIKFIGSGHSVEAWAGKIGAGRTMVYYWREHHADFKEALELALDLRTQYCENLLKSLATGERTGNPASAIFLAKNWTQMRDQTDLEVKGALSVTMFMPEPHKSDE